jgi:hypothetical protein
VRVDEDAQTLSSSGIHGMVHETHVGRVVVAARGLVVGPLHSQPHQVEAQPGDGLHVSLDLFILCSGRLAPFCRIAINGAT